MARAAMQYEPLGCPRCSGILKVVMRKVEHPSGAVLDVCDRCGGMWLDGPEVKLLYSFSEGSGKKPGKKRKK